MFSISWKIVNLDIDGFWKYINNIFLNINCQHIKVFNFIKAYILENILNNILLINSNILNKTLGIATISWQITSQFSYICLFRKGRVFTHWDNCLTKLVCRQLSLHIQIKQSTYFYFLFIFYSYCSEFQVKICSGPKQFLTYNVQKTQILHWFLTWKQFSMILLIEYTLYREEKRWEGERWKRR